MRAQAEALTASAAGASPKPVTSRPCHCIIKLGGSAITHKSQLETLKPDVLQHICNSIQQLHKTAVDGIVLVHGAGSFGHFQASQYQVAQGGRDQQSAVEGFTLTRQSVTQLNHHVVSALIAAGVPAVGLSPCGVWTTASRQPQQTGAGIAAVQAVLQQGMVPVLHGDCVMDTQLGVTILSGDTIIRVLAKALQPQYCVFLTDVAGLYTAPPDGKPDAVLVQTVEVYPDGSWQVPAVPAAATATVGNDKRDTVGSGSDGKVSVQLSAAVHDTTGGIATKIQEAAGVVLAGCPVVIVQAGTAAGAAAVMKGPSAFSSSSTGGSSQLAGTVIQPADCAEIT